MNTYHTGSTIQVPIEELPFGPLSAEEVQALRESAAKAWDRVQSNQAAFETRQRETADRFFELGEKD